MLVSGKRQAASGDEVAELAGREGGSLGMTKDDTSGLDGGQKKQVGDKVVSFLRHPGTPGGGSCCDPVVRLI